jgi:hypothetical protein
MKPFLVLLLCLLALASCSKPDSTVVATPGETDFTSTPTLAPYWDQLPLTLQPEGDWRTYRNDELNLAFQYPTMYDKDKCRQVWFEDKYWRNPPSTVIGLGSINITVVEAENWSGNLTDQASQLTTMPEIQMLTAIEPFSMDGVPALRVIVQERQQTNPNIDYTKQVFVAFAGRFYRFTYFHLIHASTGCEAPLFSEEAVYDHLISTVEFDP